LLNTYTYQLQFIVHLPDGRQLTESRKIRASNSEEINAAFIEILKNEYPNQNVSGLTIFQTKD
jgi:hypothetical protein